MQTESTVLILVICEMYISYKYRIQKVNDFSIKGRIVSSEKKVYYCPSWTQIFKDK